MGHRLLITDDSMMIRQIIRDLAVASGWEVVGEAENGAEAVEKFKLLRPDVTTLDLVMPIHDGLYALRGIREVDARARVLVISAISQKEVLREAIALGAADFIVKPFQLEHATRALALLAGEPDVRTDTKELLV